MAISEATRLLAPGVDVVLGDGKTYQLIFDMEALVVLEDELGSLDTLPSHLQAAADVQLDDNGFPVHDKRGRLLGTDGKPKATWPPGRLRAYYSGMVAGLSHYGKSRKEIVKLLAFKDVVNYVTALTEAFNQAMPALDETDLEADPNAHGSRASSPGNGTTRSRRSATVGRPKSSGA